jgi:hypothetical protein
MAGCAPSKTNPGSHLQGLSLCLCRVLAHDFGGIVRIKEHIKLGNGYQGQTKVSMTLLA